MNVLQKLRKSICITVLAGFVMVACCRTTLAAAPAAPVASAPQTTSVAVPQRAASELSTYLTFVLLQRVLAAVKMVVHECGHAAVVCAYDPNALQGIHLFTYETDTTKSPPLFSIDKMHVYADHLGGVTTFAPLPEPYATLCTLAGGVAGCSFCYLILAAITTYCCYQDRHQIVSALVDGLKKSINPFTCVANARNLSRTTKAFLLEVVFITIYSLVSEAFYAFTPNHYMGRLISLMWGDWSSIDDDLENHALEGDGEQLWNRVCDRHSLTRKAVRVLAALGQVACTALAYKQLHAAQRQLV
jgi:hypothetical protein